MTGLERRNVVSAADDAYVQHYVVMLASFLGFNAPERYTFHLLTTSLSDEVRERLLSFVSARGIDLRIVDVTERISTLGDLKVTQHVSLATYFRLLIPSVIDDGIQEVLYLDSDLVVLDDVGPLFDLEARDFAAAAVTDPLGGQYFREHGLARAESYFNAGVLQINLSYWRQHDVARAALNYARRFPERLHCWDQCALNAVLNGQVRYLDGRWNRQVRNVSAGCDAHRELVDAAILHFTGSMKPWLYVCEMPGKEYYWEYLAGTPWHGYVPPDRTLPNRLKRVLPARARRSLRRLLQRRATAISGQG